MARHDRDPSCVFCRIFAGQIPSRKAYEDDELLVFHDIAPWAPVHVLVIPKEQIAPSTTSPEDHTAMLGRMMALAPRLMRGAGRSPGFRTLVNTGPDGRQEYRTSMCMSWAVPVPGEGLT
jgi:histidine triad (HIT) family protein